MKLISSVVALSCLAVVQLNAGMIQLDWGTAGVNWTAGALSHSFDIDASNPGDDITITLDPGSGGSAAVFVPGSPFMTGPGGSPNGPELAWDVANLTNSRAVTVILAFHYAGGVSNVSFITNDIDAPTADTAEEINSIFARLGSGPNVAVSSITAGTNQSLSGTGLTTVLAANTNAGNSTGTESNSLFQFSPSLDLISFTFARQNGANGNLNNLMRLDSIQYDTGEAVPEPATYSLALAAFAGMLVLRRRKKCAVS